MAKVELKSIRKSFGSTLVIPDLSLKVESGEFVALVGPSGCGKSTLLRMVAGLDHPTAGSIQIDGREVGHLSPKERGVAMVFQNYALYPHMSVRRNLEFPLKMARVDVAETAKRVGEAAEILGLSELLERKPAQLSGGQKQRVAMARAIVRKPKVLLFDEPLSNLDAQLRHKVRAEIAQLHRRLGATILYVTHDQIEAMTLADRMAVLNKGVLEQYGEPLEVYHHPKTRFVAGFIGTPPMNFIPASSLKGATDRAKSAGVRPERTRFGDSSSGEGVSLGRGKVSLIEPLGSTTHVHIRIGDAQVISEVKTENLPELEQEVSVWTSPKELFYFDDSGARIP